MANSLINTLAHRLNAAYNKLLTLLGKQPVTLGVRIIIESPKGVLLVKHSYISGWHLPGGAVEVGETLEEAIRRESREELGAKLGTVRIHGLYSNFYEAKSDHIIVFRTDECTLGTPEDDEIEEIGWFLASEPPEETSPGTMRRLAEFESEEIPLFTRW